MKSFFEKLKIPKHNANILVSGIGQGSSNITHCTNILPHVSFPVNSICIPKHINLADDQFHKSKEIDILLGANIFWDLIIDGQIYSGKNALVIKNTKLGWLISEYLPFINSTVRVCATASLDHTIQALLKRDDFQTPGTYLSTDDNYCNNHLLETVGRDETGKFILKIPLKENLDRLGNSVDITKTRISTKVTKQQYLKTSYSNLINEYIALNHMSQIPRDECNNLGYFFPHHSVTPDNSTTKLRVVFDGSEKSDNDLSLNDVQFPGPSLQSDISAILLRFRKHNFIVTADI